MSTTKDIRTKEGWNAFLDRLCAMMSDRAKDSEAQLAECNLLLTANPETGEAYGKPGVYTMLTKFSGSTDEEVEASKDNYVTVMRTIAVAGCAIGAAFLSEAWLSCRTQKQVDNEGYVQPANDPERKEALIMMVQHKEFGTGMRQAPIEQVDGKRRLGEWTNYPGQVGGGRFTNFVPPDYAVENKEFVALARQLARQRSTTGEVVPMDRFVAQLKEKKA